MHFKVVEIRGEMQGGGVYALPLGKSNVRHCSLPRSAPDRKPEALIDNSSDTLAYKEK